MTVAEVEILIDGNTQGVDKAFARTKEGAAGMAKAVEKQTDAAGESVGGLRKSFVALATGVDQTTRETAVDVKRIGTALDEIKAEVQEVAQQYKRSMKEAADSTEEPAKRLKATALTLNQFGENAHRVGLTMTAAITAPLMLAGKEGLNLAGDFEQSMNVMRVTSNATAAEMKRVSAAAIALGNDAKLPGTSSVDAAHAMLELSKAGLSVTDTLGAARGVLEMSAAANIDNAKAATVAANALNSFGLKGTDAVRVSDLLAAAANASSASVESLADGLAQSSAVYASAGLSIENLTASLAMMANRGVQGSDAGTSLKTMLMSLQAPSKDAAAALGKLGVNVYDAHGKMIAYRGIIAQFEKALTGLNQKQRDVAMAQIFGTDAVRAATVVFGSGVKAYNAMEIAVSKQGAGAKMAAAMNDGYKGALDGATSAGQTMLQGFLEPALPVLTDFMKWTSSVASSINDWPGPMKAAAGGVGAVLAVTGPAAVVLGTLSSSISAIIGLKAMFVGAMNAKAAATTAAGTAATGAAAAEEAEAVAESHVAAGAETAAASVTQLAAANTASAASARAATGSMSILRGSVLSLMGLAKNPIVFTIATVVTMRGDRNQAVDDDRYGRHLEDPQLAKIADLYKSKGKAAALAFAQGQRKWWERGDLANEQVGDAEEILKRRESAKRQAEQAQFRDFVLNSHSRYQQKQATDSAGAAAAKEIQAALANMKTIMPKVKGSGGGGRKSAGERAAEKEAKAEASAVKQLQDQYYEASKAVKLYGNDKASASLQYDLDHGKILREGQAVAKSTIAKLKDKEALDAWKDAKKSAADSAKEWADATLDHAKAMGAETIGLSEQDRVSMTMFGKRYSALTNEHNKQRVLWQIEEDRAKAEKERYDAGQQYAKDTLDSLQHEIALKSALTRVDQARLEIAERRKKGETITADQEKGILNGAKVLDDADWKDQLDAFGAELQSTIDDAVNRTREARQSAKDAALSRYSDAMAQLRERLTLTGTETGKVQAQTIKLAESYGVGATAADRIRTGMSRAQAVMAASLQVDKVEAWKSSLRDMASTAGDWFGKLASGIGRDFDLSFKGVLSSFTSMLAQMAAQQVQAQVTRGATSWITNALGGIFGGGGGGFVKGAGIQGPTADNPFYRAAGRATGGPVLKGTPYRVVEDGKGELFVPSSDGFILNARDTKRAAGGGNVTVHMTVVTPDLGSFKDSETQTALRLAQKIRSATGAVG